MKRYLVVREHGNIEELDRVIDRLEATTDSLMQSGYEPHGPLDVVTHSYPGLGDRILVVQALTHK